MTTTTIAPLEERRMLGIGLVLGGFFMFTGIDTSAKWLGLAGLPALQIVFLRYAIHLGLVSAVHFPERGLALVRTKHLRVQLVRALGLLGATVSNFIAVQYLPLTVTGSVAFTLPLFVCALSVPMLGEQVGWRRWTAVAVGFAGILIIVRPGTEAFHPAMLLSLLGTFSASLYFLLTRRLAGLDTAATQQFYVGLFATVALAPFALSNWVWPTQTADWVAFFTVGFCGYIGHQLSTVAARFAPASVLAPFAYVQIIFMTASSWLIFNQPPEVWLFIGAPIVIGSGLYIWLRERKMTKVPGQMAG